MKIVVTANGAGLDAQASPVFGRCPFYVFIDTDSMEVESVENPAVAAPGGAGIQAAQFVVERGARAAVTGNVGPNAFNVLRSAGVTVHLFSGGTVRQAVEEYRAGRLSVAGEASTSAHAGMGMGRGSRAAASVTSRQGGREEEIAALRETVGGLRKQLAEVLERLDKLEKGV